MFSCKKNTKLVSDNMERELTRAERASMFMHSMFCMACRSYRRQIKALDILIRNHYRNTPDTTSATASKDTAQAKPSYRPMSLSAATRQKFNQLVATAMAHKKNR